jgi:hypothetical protein
MISRGWTEMGCGRSKLTMWTQNFGGMTGKNLKTPDPLPPLRPEIMPEPDEGEAAQTGETKKGKNKGKGRVGDKPPPGPPPAPPPTDEPPKNPDSPPPSDPGMSSGG